MHMGKQELNSLITAAKLAAIVAKPIKSGVTVGCVIQVGDGGPVKKRIAGANVEYHGHFATHAEVVALTKLISNGLRVEDIEAICVWFSPKIQFPCGSCLQALASHLSAEIMIIAASEAGHDIKTLGELLPFAYTSRD